MGKKVATPSKKSVKKPRRKVKSESPVVDGVEVVLASKTTVSNHNFEQLKRKDPAIAGIKLMCSHVTVYEYKGEWKNMNISGPMFIYHRGSEAPHFKAIVFNQKTDQDLVLALSPVKVHIDSTVINVRIGEEIFGLWVSDSEEKEALGKCLKQVENWCQVHLTFPSTANKSAAENVTILSKSTIGRQIDIKQLLANPLSQSAAPLYHHAGFRPGPVHRHNPMHVSFGYHGYGRGPMGPNQFPRIQNSMHHHPGQPIQQMRPLIRYPVHQYPPYHMQQPIREMQQPHKENNRFGDMNTLSR